jgi:glutamine synthetase
MEIKKVLGQAEKDNIEFVSLQFTDLLGVVKEVAARVSRALRGYRRAICS